MAPAEAGAFLLAFWEILCYLVIGAASNGRRLAPAPRGFFLPLIEREGVFGMVTYDELFQFCLVLIGFAGLIVQITKKK